jgi:chloride channel protein, CIC family
MEIRKRNYFEAFIYRISERTNEKQFMIFSSILVGASAGLAAVLLKLLVFFIQHHLIEEYLASFNYTYLYLAFPVLGIGLSVLIIKYMFKGDINKGNASILFAIAKKSSFLPFHQMYSHLITSGLTVGFGGSAGVESPIVSTGSAIGSNFAKTYKLGYKERTLLLAAGAAGGIAGAFNAPIAGVLFALEVILVDISISAFIPLLIAAASGALISKMALDENALLFFKLQTPFDYRNTPFYVLLGVLSGVLSLYYVRFFDTVESAFTRWRSHFGKWLLGSACLVILYFLFPALFGEGYASIKSLAEIRPLDLFKNSFLQTFTSEKWSLMLLLTLVMLLKAFAAAITIGSGGNGGNFAPSLFIGAHLGFIFSMVLSLIGFQNIPASNFTIVGMSGILSGLFHAPLTGIFLIAEITGGYELIIPLMIVSAISYAVVKYFHPVSLDVKRLKEKGAIVSESKDEIILSRINLSSLIETDFSTIHFKGSMRDIVETIKHCKRNTFPVVKKNNRLLGLIYLDSIRAEMFNTELYDKVTAREVMHPTTVVIDINDDVFVIMKKFEESGQWNLPVVNQGIYVGFLSKSSLLDKYRHLLLDVI